MREDNEIVSHPGADRCSELADRLLVVAEKAVGFRQGSRGDIRRRAGMCFDNGLDRGTEINRLAGWGVAAKLARGNNQSKRSASGFSE